MTISAIAGQNYVWKGAVVKLLYLDDDAGAVQIPDSLIILPVKASELSPVPSRDEEAMPALRIPEDQWSRAMALSSALSKIISTRKNKVAAVKDVALSFRLSVRRVYILLKQYRLNPTIWACLVGKPGRKKGSRSAEIDQERAMQACLSEHYLKPEKPSIKVAYDALDAACAAAGIKTPCLNTLRNRVDKLERAELIRRREGSKRAREVCQAAAGHVDVERPLERVEIDHTLCDVQLRADTPNRELLGRPWVTLAIDCFSRMVLGFYVCFDHPSSKSVALCLAHSFLPKKQWMKYFGIPGEWPAHGFPTVLVDDNAMEFRAKAVRRGCNQFGITMVYRPPGEPQYGGAIERLIGTLMGRVHMLPGTTQRNVVEKGNYDSERRAQMTLREFTEWLTLEIVTNYHTTTHRTLGKPPLIAWKEAWGDALPPEPGTPLEVLAAFLPAATRVLRRTGVEIHRANYWSDDFSRWVGEGREVSVHDHPFDMHRVYVRLPNGELTVARNMSAKPETKLTLTDTILRAAGARNSQHSIELREIRHSGHRRKQQIVANSAEAMRKSRGRSHITTPPSAAIKPVPLYRPQPSLQLPIHFGEKKNNE